MDVYKFGSTVICKDGLDTEQFGDSDYRFDLLKNESDLDNRSDIVKHKYLCKIDKTLSFINGKFVSSLGFNIPKRLLMLSSLNIGDSSYVRPYMNAFMNIMRNPENEKTPEEVVEDLANKKPYFTDGTKLVELNDQVHADYIKRWWPNISAGVNKKLISAIRSGGSMNLYSIGFMFDDLDNNKQIGLITDIKNSIYRDRYDLIDLYINKDDMLKLYKRKELIKKVKTDIYWTEHLMQIVEVNKEIIKVVPTYRCPTSYTFTKTLSIMNSVKSKMNKHAVPFKMHWHKYGFFHGLALDEYKLHIFKDSFELVDFGALLNICIGSDTYTDKLSSGDHFMAIVFKGSQPWACVHYEVCGAEVQFHKADNAKLTDEEYKKLRPWIKDIVTLNQFKIKGMITEEFAINQLKSLYKEIPKIEFMSLARNFGVNVTDIIKLVEKEEVTI